MEIATSYASSWRGMEFFFLSKPTLHLMTTKWVSVKVMQKTWRRPKCLLSLSFSLSLSLSLSLSQKKKKKHSTSNLAGHLVTQAEHHQQHVLIIFGPGLGFCLAIFTSLPLGFFSSTTSHAEAYLNFNTCAEWVGTCCFWLPCLQKCKNRQI